MDFVRSQVGNTNWLFHVTNRGHERAEKLELQVPYAIESLLIHSDGSEEIIAGGIIRIPELRPGDSVRVLSWVDRSVNPKLLQASGKATMRFQELVDARLARVYRIYRQMWRDSPTLLTLMVVSFLLSIAVLVWVLRKLLYGL